MDNLQNLDPEQIKQLIGLLQTMLPSSNEANTPKKKTNKKKNAFSKSVTRNKRVIEEDRENKFLSMPESKMHKSDSLIDKKLNKFPPTPRSRGFDFIEVQCRICGKTEEISPKLVPESRDRYKCNQCSSSEG